MSIYRSRDALPTQSDVTEPVTRRAIPTPDSAPPNGDWTSVRKGKPADHLLPKSLQWLDDVPQAVRPWALIKKYPRIVNMLAVDWREPAACHAYFADLLLDRRGHRKGFPEDVDRDLRRLRDYYRGEHTARDKRLCLLTGRPPRAESPDRIQKQRRREVGRKAPLAPAPTVAISNLCIPLLQPR